jgi:peroxiredoxin
MAPDFELKSHLVKDKKVRLSDFRGKKSVVLAFYPLDFSPVCTDQLNVYQEVLGELEAAGASLYGVSVDSAFAHKAFQERMGLTIPLLADFNPKGAVARSYGVYLDERGHAARALVLIDADGIVEWTYAAPSPLEIPGANLIFDALERTAA